MVNRHEFAGELFDHHAEEVRRYVLGWTLDRSSALDLTTKVLRTAVDRRDQILEGADAAGLEMRVFALARAAVTRWQTAPKRGETVAVVPEESTALFGALGQLDDNQREVLIFRELVGLDPDRVGRVLGCDQSVVDDLHHQASEALWRKLDGAPEDASVSTWDRLTVGAALRRAAAQWLTPADGTALAVLREQLLGEAPVGVPAKAPQREAATAKTKPTPARDRDREASGGPAGHGVGGTAAGTSGGRAPGDQAPRAKLSPAARSSRKSAAAAVKAAAAAAAAKAGGPAAAVLSPPSAPTDPSMPLPPSPPAGPAPSSRLGPRPGPAGPPVGGHQGMRREGPPPKGAPASGPAADALAAAAAAGAVAGSVASAGSAGSAVALAGSAGPAAPAAAKPGARGERPRRSGPRSKVQTGKANQTGKAASDLKDSMRLTPLPAGAPDRWGLRGLRGLRGRVLALVGSAPRERWIALGAAAVVAAGIGVVAALTVDAGGTPACAEGSGCLVSTTLDGGGGGGAPPLGTDGSGNLPTTTLGGIGPSPGIPDDTAGETTTTDGGVSTTVGGPDTTVKPPTTLKPPTTVPPTTVKPPTTVPPSSDTTVTSGPTST